MDDAGWHDAALAIEICVQTLLDEVNIKITYQMPKSPETNLIDIGV